MAEDNNNNESYEASGARRLPRGMGDGKTNAQVFGIIGQQVKRIGDLNKSVASGMADVQEEIQAMSDANVDVSAYSNVLLATIGEGVMDLIKLVEPLTAQALESAEDQYTPGMAAATVGAKSAEVLAVGDDMDKTSDKVEKTTSAFSKLGAVLGMGGGGVMAGRAVGGRLKKYELDVDESLVPGGIFYGRNREELKNRIDDLNEATKDLTRAQRQGIAKDTITSYLLGRGLGKLGEAKITEQGLSLDDLFERGDINRVDYLKNVFKSSFGGLSDTELQKLNVLNRDVTPLGTSGNLMGAYGNYGVNLEIPQELLPQKTVEEIMKESRDAILNFDTTIDPFRSRNKRNSLFQQTVGPIGGMY